MSESYSWYRDSNEEIFSNTKANLKNFGFEEVDKMSLYTPFLKLYRNYYSAQLRHEETHHEYIQNSKHLRGWKL
jgi:hypothetical protein